MIPVGPKLNPQWLAGSAVLALVVQFGFIYGWTSPALARLTVPSSPIPMDLEQASWMAAFVNLSRFLGAIVGPIAGDFLGSKRCIVVSLMPLAAGWLLVALASNVLWLYSARLLSGLGVGMAFSVFPLYLGEVAEPRIRGGLVSLGLCGGSFGQLVASACGAYMPVLECGYIYFGLALILACVFLFFPESPHHLVKSGQLEAARASIDWYRGGKDVDQELAAISKFVASDGQSSFADRLRKFREPHVRMATIQVIVLFSLMQSCGLNSLIFYMESILLRAHFELLEPSLVVVCVNVCSALATICSVFLIDRCGRKCLLFASSAGVSVSMTGLATYFWLIDAGAQPYLGPPSFLRWLPALCMILFVVAFCFGLLIVPSTVLSETFSTDTKCLAASISGVTAASVAFASSKTYQPMVDLMGEAYVFVIYGACTLVAIPYTLFVMPETKGKSLQQIQDKLMTKA